MMGIFLRFTAVSLLIGHGALSGFTPCQTPVLNEEIDWDRLNENGVTWYDAIDIPKPPMAVDCWDWTRVDVTERGIVGRVLRWVEGSQAKPKKIDVNFKKVEGKIGIYKLMPENKEGAYNSTSEAIAHKPDEEEFEDLEETFDVLYNSEYFFQTDYHNYLLMASCLGEAGWGVWIKTRNWDPTVPDIIRGWNSMVDLGIHGKMYLKKVCTKRNREENGGK